MFFLHLYSYPIILIIITLEKGVYYIKESQPFVAGSLLFSYCSGFNQEPVPLILPLILCFKCNTEGQSPLRAFRTEGPSVRLISTKITNKEDCSSFLL